MKEKESPTKDRAIKTYYTNVVLNWKNCLIFSNVYIKISNLSFIVNISILKTKLECVIGF